MSISMRPRTRWRRSRRWSLIWRGCEMTTMPEVLDLAAQMKAAEESFVLATVVRTVSVTAAKAGAKAIIRPDGTIVAGWIGGGGARGAGPEGGGPGAPPRRPPPGSGGPAKHPPPTRARAPPKTP